MNNRLNRLFAAALITIGLLVGTAATARIGEGYPALIAIG